MPSDNSRFLSRAQVDKWHRFSLSKYGGSDGLRSESGLESALNAPINDFYYREADLFEIAAAYAFHIAQAQAYLDGNKRTGVAAALAFLQINGISTDRDAFSLYEALVAVGERRMTKPELAARFRHLFES